MKNGIRLNVIGRVAELPTNVRKNLQDTMDKTAKNSNLLLSLALNYGARTELLDAVTSYISQNDLIIVANLNGRPFRSTSTPERCQTLTSSFVPLASID